MAKKKKQNWVWIVILIVIALVILSSIKKKEEPMIEVKFYDENKNLIEMPTGMFSIIGDIPGFTYITFTTKVENIGDRDLEVQITSATITPSNSPDLYNALDTTSSYNIKPGEDISFGESDFIYVPQFEGTTQTFTVFVTGTYAYPEAPFNQFTKSGSVTLTIRPEIEPTTTTTTTTTTIPTTTTTTIPLPTILYQEDSDATLCGLACGGNGAWSATYPCSNTYDGNWGTYGIAGNLAIAVCFDYTVPSGALSSESKWQIKHSGGIFNYTIPSNCWGSELQLLIYSDIYAADGVWIQCYDYTSGGYYQIFGDATDPGGKVYEEAMWWVS